MRATMPSFLGQSRTHLDPGAAERAPATATQLAVWLVIDRAWLTAFLNSAATAALDRVITALTCNEQSKLNAAELSELLPGQCSPAAPSGPHAYLSLIRFAAAATGGLRPT